MQMRLLFVSIPGIGHAFPMVPLALRCVVEAARQVAAEFVLAVEASDAQQLGALPPNVKAAGWVPLEP
ncbi:hypothetical protein [Saccharopolyspora sp. 5N708]|uniref:hypothetical protein n=1 Tax=Saccharopolyspora sp. 5N708 TaxID=3457424 RepID=UPI003FD2152A